MKRFSRLYISVLIITFACGPSLQEKRETPVEKSAEKKVTIAEVEQGIRANIDAITQENGGYFPVSNDSTDLRLKLVRVHTEYLSVLGPNEFFACVDLATENGDVYDVDFFLNGTAEDMNVTRTDVHKLNGKPYYTWKQAKDKTWYTVPVKNASNDLLGVIEGTDEFEFTYTVDIPEITENGKLWIPVATSDDYQAVGVLSIESPGDYQMVKDNAFGNTILYMTVSPSYSGKQVSITYHVIRKEKSAYENSGGDPSVYLEATPLLPVGDRFSVIAEDVISRKQAETPLMKARALYDYIIDEMRYAKQGVYGTGDANFACDSKSGNCTEFHSFFISLARSAGIPARFAVGAAIPSERNEGGVDGYHCWAEFYADGKWWPVDISEANKYTALATYYFGHHPANRIEFSKGRQIKPDPMPESGPVNFLAYPVFEVGGQPDKVETTFTFKRLTDNS